MLASSRQRVTESLGGLRRDVVLRLVVLWAHLSGSSRHCVTETQGWMRHRVTGTQGALASSRHNVAKTLGGLRRKTLGGLRGDEVIALDVTPFGVPTSVSVALLHCITVLASFRLLIPIVTHRKSHCILNLPAPELVPDHCAVFQRHRPDRIVVPANVESSRLGIKPDARETPEVVVELPMTEVTIAPHMPAAEAAHTPPME